MRKGYPPSAGKGNIRSETPFVARIVGFLMEPHSLTQILGNVAVVFLLILLGSIFVAAEIALISLRESQIKQIALKGKRGARVAALAENPNRFLAAAQVGVTFCGFLSAALGAERLGVYVEPELINLGLSEGIAALVSLIGITIMIAYFSLVFGELVPKRLALFRTEQISLALAPINLYPIFIAASTRVISSGDGP